MDMFNCDDVEGEEKVGMHIHNRKLVDAAVDGEGYYLPQLGEVLNNRFRVTGYFGKGVFGSVLRCTDLSSPDNQEVAIKLLRQNDSHDLFKSSGLNEVKIHELLTKKDPERKYNIVRLVDSFTSQGHLCIVFEALDINLRQLINKYGRGEGLGLQAVKGIAFQTLKALYHVKRCGVIHADFKPDNLLISKDRCTVRVADLGSALLTSEEITKTPELVSRFYRAPEIVIGSAITHAIDMFSFGCCIYELATGTPLFNSKNPNHHLKLIMDVVGKIPKKILRSGEFTHEHFGPDDSFLESVWDSASEKPFQRKVYIGLPTRSVANELLRAYYIQSEREEVVLMADLVLKCVLADPEKRITPEAALRHPFFVKPQEKRKIGQQERIINNSNGSVNGENENTLTGGEEVNESTNGLIESS
jgi:serine/threonine-protein kinase PRP4